MLFIILQYVTINRFPFLYLFTVDASPILCPIRGPLTFTYNRGHGECMNPVSIVDSCSDIRRLLFRYQACPDIEGTESTGKLTFC